MIFLSIHSLMAHSFRLRLFFLSKILAVFCPYLERMTQKNIAMNHIFLYLSLHMQDIFYHSCLSIYASFRTMFYTLLSKSFRELVSASLLTLLRNIRMTLLCPLLVSVPRRFLSSRKHIYIHTLDAYDEYE